MCNSAETDNDTNKPFLNQQGKRIGTRGNVESLIRKQQTKTKKIESANKDENA